MKKTQIKLRGGSALSVLALLGGTVCASVAVSAPAAAQDFTNVTASGRVVDKNGKPIPGATVSVTSNTQGFKRSVETDGSGSYRIPLLPQGAYTFEISATGFGSFRDDNVDLTQASGGNSFQLVSNADIAAAGSEIIVTGSRVRVSDFDRTTTGAVINIAEIEDRVPVARDLTSVVLLAPGTTLGDSAFGSLPAIAGGSVSENTYFINGLNITDFRKGLGSVEVPFELYNTIEVKTGSIPAEFGRFTGGFVNATTRSGGNEFHGKVLFNYIPNGLYETRPNTLVDENSQDTRETTQTLVSLSGPIMKDHIFFYGFYQTNNIKQGDTLLTVNPNTIVGGVAVAPYSTGLRREERSSTSPYWGGKIDVIPFDGQRLEFTYFDSSKTTSIASYGITDASGGGYDTRVDKDGPRTGAYLSTSVLEEGGENYVGRYTGQFTNWLTVSGAYGKNRSKDISGSTRNDYPFISDTSGNFSPALSGNSLNTIDASSDQREFYRGDVDVYANLFGKHHFKFGYDRENLTTRNTTSYTGGVAWTYVNSGVGGDVYVTTPNTLYVTGRTFVNGGTFKSKNDAFYLQDSWSLLNDRLNLNLGIRNDRFENKNVDGKTFYKSGNQWGPRLAFALDPWGDSKTKIWGSFGRYFIPVVANTNIRLAGAELDYTRYFLVQGVNSDNTPKLGAPVLGFADAQACPDTGVLNCDITSDGRATPTEATVAKNLKPQSVDEYTFGIERSLGGRITVSLFGQYRKLNESLEDVAIDAAVLNYCSQQKIAGCDDLWTGFHQYALVNPGAASRITLSEPINGETTLRTVDFSASDLGYPKAKRTYKAITAKVSRDFDGKWSLDGSYTWSELKGNIEGGVRSDNGQDDSGLTTAFDQPGLTDGAYGYLPGHARHNIKVFGSYAITEWLTFGTQFQALSPRKFGCIGRVPVKRDAFAGSYGAAGFYCNLDSSGKVITDPAYAGFANNTTTTSLSVTPRGSQLESDWTIFTNVTMTAKVPTKAFDASFRVDVFNLFNQKGVTDLNETGTQGNGRPRGDYGTPRGYQQPRYFRFQLAVGF
ncbi:Carboxypeptidase regulatory-like domain-containing protein [Sphingomonas sp. NFR04]|uniref:TonB-dependent receptor n=1 Tax=Sphingomonas sp. NFR04 TaxID=1566283 RepID=UPI0008F37720|nr:TonB-dependent receptor [Sphingomonas sp. NFR04]SFK32483.1 Carboxypeptidase regulatory-like domain-containing protein [Sphingomonas sp. NFR04]